MRAHSTAVIGFAAAALLCSAACSGSTSDRPRLTGTYALSDVAKATATAGGTATGVVELAGRRTTFAVAWHGDFRTGVGEAHGTLPEGGSSVPLDVRWRGGIVYLRRSGSKPDDSPMGQLITQAPAASKWTVVPAANIAARVVAIFSPADLLRILAASGTPTTAPGPTMAGVATKHVTLTANQGLLFNFVDTKHSDVFVDGTQLARRIAVRQGADRVALDVRYSKAVPHVTLPSAGELRHVTPPPITPIGPYITVRTGTTAGVTWTVQRAPGRDSYTCWRWSSTPALAVFKSNYSTDTRCIPPSAADASIADRIEFVLTTDGSRANEAAVVAVLPPSITTATLGYIGGRTEPTAITGGLLVWVGSSDTPLAYVGVTSAGATINCGIGAVSSPGDLTNDQLVGNPFGSAWLCQS